MDFVNMTIEELLQEEGHVCSCGKTHKVPLKELVIETGALQKVPRLVQKYDGTKPFLIADKNTWAAAGEKVAALLTQENIPYGRYIYPDAHVGVDATPVGEAVMHFDHTCDMILGIGSGTINDISKIMAHVTGKPYIVVATAPSMDGFSSSTSSMAVDGVKVSLPSTCPVAIVGDIDVLKNAPMRMLQAGLGDILAKYVSICEWRMAEIIVGEYYCPAIAELVRESVRRCAASAEGLLNREPEAVYHVMFALVLSGIAMSFADVTRPASGMEHYFSHVWDMRALAFGTPEDLHGIQVSIGTVLSLKMYDALKKVTPEKEKALAYAAAFDKRAWEEQLGAFLGDAAPGLIALEEVEGKFDATKHKMRLETILIHWEELQRIMHEELPAGNTIEEMLKKIGAPASPVEIGIDGATTRQTFLATKDIRDKYIGTKLLWDLGLLDEFAEELFS
ncbi:MAG: sn-glycerol-1-phosphate dehydrogenase [Christensenellaceae bacterium]|jgi:glycerol-1-phosphate dehydrogenase [NAD(P)+]